MKMGTEVVSPKGVVAANPPDAARVGARVLEAGGNAMDAAVAASMACCMLRPNQTGIGGYVCSAVVRDAQADQVWCVDANGVAPAAARPDMYRLCDRRSQPDRDGINEWEYACSVEGNDNLFGPLSVSVPGMMAGMGFIHERWGRLPWVRIVEPSQSLLADGFPYEEVARSAIHMEFALRRFPASVAHLMPGGVPPSPDDRWHRPDMEKTLARLAAAGWRDFYEGEIGRTIADHLRAQGGIITREDMAAYRPRLEAPLSLTYRRAQVHSAIPPNGGVSALQTLALLDHLDLPAEDSPQYWHLLAETLKLVWRDRLHYIADPDFTDVPLRRLLGADYAAGRTETLRRFPYHVDVLVPEPVPEPPNGTLHVSAADSAGNLVSMTISQGFAFGSCLTVPGTGIILGHGMARFDPRPGRSNSIAPRKRPLNNTAAMLVRLPERDVALGVPGGRKIVSVMARAAHLLADRDCTGFQVSTAPRLHIEANEPLEVLDAADATLVARLEAMGHQVKRAPAICGVLNCAEYLVRDRLTRGGSSESAAGAE